jgi:hypothetical protein
MSRFIILAVLLVIPIMGSSTVLKKQDGAGEGPPLTSPLLEKTASCSPAPEPCRGVSDSDRTHIQQSFGRLPLYFIENQGQLDEEVAFYVKGSDKTLYFTPNSITFALASRKERPARRDLFGIERREGNEEPGQSDDSIKRWIVKMDFVGANPGVKPMGKDRQEAIFSYFKGKPDEWKVGIPSYSRVIYEELWPGIDRVYSGTVNKLKYDFIVKPGADPQKIRFDLSGASDVVFAESGVLEVKTPLGGFEDEKPTAFQKINGRQLDVPVVYTLDRSDSGDLFSLGFEVGAYDSREMLVIDPAVLVYCGYIGGANSDLGFDVAVDGEGYAFITGETNSSETDGFPVLAGFDPSFNGGQDAFIAKISVSGDSLVYCSYIGGQKNDGGSSIATDAPGNVYIAGYTYSSENDNFPVTIGPDLTHNGGYYDAFVAKVSASGTSLLYCGYIGGSKTESARVAVSSQGIVYVAGTTSSSEADGFPVSVGPDLTYNGGYYDAYVTKLAYSGTHLEYCGYIGGNKIDYGDGIAVDCEGNAYVSGSTLSSEYDGFPVSSGPDLIHNGSYDGFVAKVAVSGRVLNYCGYIGGTEEDYIGDIKVKDQSVYVVGTTSSKKSNGFPVKLGPDLSFNGDRDVFVAKVTASGDSLIYCGYIGGSDYEHANSIAVDAQGSAYVTGETTSRQDEGFPVLEGPDLTFNGIGPFDSDAFIAKVTASGASLAFCGYIGGWKSDSGIGIAVDALGNAYVTGYTENSEIEAFPVLVGPDLSYNYYTDAFVTKVLTTGVFCDIYNLSATTGGTVTFNLTAGAENADRKYFLLGNVSGTAPGTQLPGGLILPLNWDWFSDLVLLLANSPVFEDFCGQLNASGEATAQLNAGPLDPAFVGAVLHFAYVLYAPFDFVSNPVPITIVP